MQRSFITTCVFHMVVFYIDAIEPDGERNNVFPHFILFFLHHQIWIGLVNEVYVHYARQSRFEVCVMLQNCKMFCNLNIIHYLLCCSMKTIVDDGHYKLHLQVCSHIVNDFGMHHAIGQSVRSYIITRHKMLVKL